MTTLLEHLDLQFAVARPLAGTTLYQYRRAIRDLHDWCGVEIAICDLCDDLINRWIASRQTTEAPKTIHNRRNAVLVLWRHAAALGLCRPPGAIRRVPVPTPIPHAWSLDELRQLLSASPAADRLLLTAAYETGLRRGDLLRLEPADVAPDGTIRTVQHKTHNGHVCQVDAATASAVRSRGGLVPTGLRRFYLRVRAACERLGIARGALQMCRRTGATFVERDQPGAAMRYLGHRTAGLAYRHYVDRSKLGAAVRPPEL